VTKKATICPIHRKRFTHEQKFGACTFWTPVCAECLRNHHWHLTRKLRTVGGGKQ
jgi:hypothetical protein